MRDLNADLAICDAATPGPWRYEESFGVIYDGDENVVYYTDDENVFDAKFTAEARTGWPEAIRRALAAEAEVERLRAIIDDRDVYQL